MNNLISRQQEVIYETEFLKWAIPEAILEECFAFSSANVYHKHWPHSQSLVELQWYYAVQMSAITLQSQHICMLGL